MPADYNIPMTDAQITEALQLMVERVSEGWAQGTYDGSPVGSGSPFYNKHSKYWAMRAADAAARAEAAVPAGTAGAVFFDREQTLTDAQQEQARQNIKAGGSNRNLLDNPWFFVNQRGATSGTAGTKMYIVDRWFVNHATYSISGDGISLAWDGITSDRAYLVQYAEIKSVILNRVITVSAIVNNTPYKFSATFGSGYAREWSFDGFTINLADSTNGVEIQIRNYSTTPIGVKAVKLELGSVSTLANDAPPNYAEELAKCQRYFLRIKTQTNSGYSFMAIGYVASATVIAVPLNIPANMRRITSVAMSGAFKAYKLDSSVNYPITAITTSNQAPGIATLSATVSGATAGLPVIFQSAGDVNAYIDLSADL